MRVRKAVAGERIDVRVRVAEFIVEVRSLHALRQLIAYVADFLAHLIPDIRHACRRRGIPGDEKYERLPRLRIAAHDVDMRRLLQLLFDLVGDLLLDFARGGARPVRAHYHHLERKRRILGLAELLVRKDPDHGEHHDQVEDERAVLERPLR